MAANSRGDAKRRPIAFQVAYWQTVIVIIIIYFKMSQDSQEPKSRQDDGDFV